MYVLTTGEVVWPLCCRTSCTTPVAAAGADIRSLAVSADGGAVPTGGQGPAPSSVSVGTRYSNGPHCVGDSVKDAARKGNMASFLLKGTPL